MFEKDSAIKVFYIDTSKIMGLLFCLAITALYSMQVVAADCSSVDITVSSQAEVDAFQTTYGGATPPCDTVTGNLTVSGADIDDLSPLSALTSVGNHFHIENNAALTDLDGLTSLVSVGNQFIILENPLLTNLDGLSALIEVKDVLLSENPTLTNLDGLSGLTGLDGFLTINLCESLTDLNGLSSLASLGGFLQIQLNSALTNLDGLSALTSIGTGGFDFGLMISSNASLTNLDGLSALTSVDGWVSIWGNDSLTNLNGLSGVTSMGSTLAIVNNPVLTNLDWLSALISVGTDVDVSDNPLLAACNGLNTLLDSVDDGDPGPGPGVAGIPDVGGDVVIGGNLSGCNSLDGILGPIFTNSFESWKNIKSPDLGVSFWVPTGSEVRFSLEHSTYSSVPIEFSDQPGTEAPTLNVRSDQNPNSLSVEEYYNGDIGSDLFFQSFNEFSIIQVYGINSYLFDVSFASTGRVIVIPRTNDFLFISNLGYLTSSELEYFLDSLVISE